jgi:tetratricopeptide (TPR) repeat protein
MGAELARHLIRLLVALLRHQARTWLGEEFMEAAGDVLAEIGGEELQRGLDEWLRAPQVADQLLQAARRAEAYVQAHCPDPALRGALTLRFADLPAVQAALADLPGALDSSGVERALQEALTRDLGRVLAPAQIDAAARLYTDALLRAVSTLKDFALPIIAQTVQDIRREQREAFAEVLNRLDQIQESLRQGRPPSSQDMAALRRAEWEGQVSIAIGERAVSLGGGPHDVVVVTGDRNIVLILKGPEAEAFRQALVHPQENVPPLPPEVPQLQTLVGRRAEERALQEIYAQVSRKRRGQTVFLTGRVGSGRHLLVQRMQETVFAQGGNVAATWFWDPRQVQPEDATRLYWDSGAMIRYGPQLADALPQAVGLIGDSWLSLAAQLTQLTQLAQQGASGLPATLGIDDPRALVQFVRLAAAERPILLTVEYLHWAHSVWIDLLRTLADEIFQDLPVLLLVTLDSPAPVDQLSPRQHTEVTRLVETLLRQGIAQSFHLGPVSAHEIAEALHTEAVLAQRLEELSGGDPWVVQLLWEEWKRHQAVERRPDGTWGINYAREGEWWVYGETRDHAEALLKRLLDRDPPPPFSLEETIAILNCAAIEGEVFTAQAVAEALEIDPDDLMDFLDDYLCAAPDNGPDTGVVCEVGFESVPGGSIFRYRFARPYLYHVFAKYPARPVERQEWSQRLAEALERLHYPLTALIADTLYRLFEAAGLPERAEPYRRVPVETPSLDLLRWHVHFLRETVPDDEVFGNYRFLEVGFQLSNLIGERRPDLWEEGYELALELHRRACLLGDLQRQGDARYDAAWHLLNGGHLREALPLAQEAVRLYEERASLDPLRLSRGLNILGRVLQDLGDLAGAKACYERALGIWERALGPEHPQVATAVNNLGRVLQDMGDLAGAKGCYERALRIFRQRLPPGHPDIRIVEENLRRVALHE